MIGRIHLAGAWSGIAYLLLFFIGFWPLAHFLPGHSPAADAQTIAAIYQGNTFGIRFGMFLLLIGAAFFLPWNVTLSTFVERMEGEDRFLSKTLLAGGVASSIFLFVPTLFWEIAAFRPDRGADLELLINDCGWIMLITAAPPFIVQCLPFGIAVLMDKRAEPLFPRWFGYATIWVAISALPGSFAFFFKTGPFAWNNLFPYWIPFIIYGNWVWWTCIFMMRAIKRGVR